MRNTENLLRLANFIETSEFPFDMHTTATPHCGTAGCIGGFAKALWRERGSVTEPMMKFCGLSYIEAETLCIWSDPVSYEEITREVAVRKLRKIAEGGPCKWSREDLEEGE